MVGLNRYMAEAPPHGDEPPFDYYLVLDFECTCERNDASYPHEIIEFPVVLLDGETLEVVDQWREFVRPVVNPILTEFCKQLTGIRQSTVDNADVLSVVLRRFHTWMGRMGLVDENVRLAFVTDGPSDFRDFYFRHSVMLQKAVTMHYPYFNQWIDLKLLYAQHSGRHSASLKTMLRELGLQFVGTPHSGIDDAMNISRVFTALLRDGVEPAYNCSVDDDVLSYLYSLPLPRLSHGRGGQRQQQQPPVLIEKPPAPAATPTSPPPLCPAPQLTAAGIASPPAYATPTHGHTLTHTTPATGNSSDTASSGSANDTPRTGERLNPHSLPYRPSHSLLSSASAGSNDELNPNSPPYRPAHIQAQMASHDHPQPPPPAVGGGVLDPESTPYRPTGAYAQQVLQAHAAAAHAAVHELNPESPPYRPAHSSDESADESLGPEEEEHWGKGGAWRGMPQGGGGYPTPQHGGGRRSHGRMDPSAHSYRPASAARNQYIAHPPPPPPPPPPAESFSMHHSHGHWGQWGVMEDGGPVAGNPYSWGMGAPSHSTPPAPPPQRGRSQPHAHSQLASERSYIFYPGHQRYAFANEAVEWG